MRIPSSTHEHGASGKVYTYEADFDIGADGITWNAVASEGGLLPRSFSGSIPFSSPVIQTLAEQAVRDAIVHRIDTFDDKLNGEPAAGEARQRVE
jgi:hypothetical protein